jgi:hypothetical protein
VAISGVAKQRRTTGGGSRGAAGDRGTVGQPQLLGDGWVRSASQRRVTSSRSALRRSRRLYSGWDSSRGNRWPTRAGAAQPVVLVVVAQEVLGHGQADHLGVGDGWWAAGAAAWRRVG